MSIVWNTENTHDTRRVIPTPQYLRPAPGMFVVESENTGYMTFARLTGDTRRFWGIACPTIKRFTINTVADPDGSIWGDPGEPIPGTFAIRPENAPRRAS